ncbi:hypothetical protein VTI74DRAFT_8300 [Chaetomium olivicolor]
MKTQSRLVGYATRQQRCGSLTQGGSMMFQHISKATPPTRSFSSFSCSANFSSSSPVRTSYRLRLGRWQRIPGFQLVGRTAFSTSARRMAESGENLATSEGAQGVPPGGKAAYPERLIIYHAGTGKTTFLACLKVTTLFVFGFFDMIMTPAYITAGEPLMKTAGIALCGIIPALFVAWSTSSFVAAIHMHLPPYARWSRSILERFARTAPPNTRLDVTTMSLIGKPRVSSMVLSDLRPADKRFGMVNFVRDTTIANAQRKWWRFRAVGEFNILEEGEKNVKTGWVWKDVRDGIKRRAEAGAEAKGKL